MTPDNILKENNENFASTPEDMLSMKKGRTKHKGDTLINVNINLGVR